MNVVGRLELGWFGGADPAFLKMLGAELEDLALQGLFTRGLEAGAFAECDSLRRLAIPYRSVDEGFVFPPNLECLDLWGDSCGEETLDSLDGLRQLSMLKVRLSPGLEEAWVWGRLAALPLERLVLDAGAGHYGGAEFWLSVPRLSALELDVESDLYAGRFLEGIGTANLRDLTLSVEEGCLSSESLRLLVDCESLEVLELWCADAGGLPGQIAVLGESKAIRRIRISDARTELDLDGWSARRLRGFTTLWRE
jgi:hypothetical protein